MDKSVILVTGGTGLVGKALEEVVRRDKVEGDWHFVGSAAADLTSYESSKALFEKLKPTHVIHLAARVGGLFANMTYKVEFLRDNLSMQDNVTRLCHEYNVAKLISCLSTCIFPDKTSYPITEEMVHNGPPHPSNEGYAYAKRLVDVMNRCYNEQHGRMFTSVVPTNIYGKYDNFNLEGGHVIPCLIHKCHLAKEAGQPFVVLGTGKPLRQFIYSIDLAALILWVLTDYNSTSPIILSPGEHDEVSIGEVARLIAAEFDYTDKLVFDTSKADGQFKKTVSNQKLMGLHPTFKFTPLAAALKETITWFKGNFEQTRR